ncbi:MAG: AtpZ/AtpI family protein [Pyrinomonadaceae bacterium]
MIGKFLQEEVSKTENNSESASFQTVEKTTSDVFTLPESTRDVLNIPENTEEISVFRESDEIIEPIPLPENQETYTVAPIETLIPATQQTQMTNETPFVETTEENMRRTGLAWSAATVLGGSVVFMLIVGWFFDLIFGSSPWGVVGGIVLGAVIGFIQFFRITSQIFKKDENNSLDLK